MITTTRTDRRRFLALAGLPIAVRKAAARRGPMRPAEFRERLAGPILSIVTCFRKDYSLDYESMGGMIERALGAGIRVFSLTTGNSLYPSLAYKEIEDLTRFMVETVAGRGITIAATGSWWTGQAVDYARFAESVGADALQVFLPQAREATDSDYADHYRAISSACRLPLVLHGQPPMKLLRMLLSIESLVAMKEEFTINYTLPVFQQFGSRLNIFAGGSLARFLEYQPYGMRAYYVDFAYFAPDLDQRFWNAVRRNDLASARAISMRYNVPFIEKWSHGFWRATFEHFGVAKRYLRPPEPSFSDLRMGEVRVFWEGLGMRPGV